MWLSSVFPVDPVRRAGVVAILVPLLLAAVLSGCGGDERLQIRIGQATAEVELAITEAARRQGLMGRRSLGPDQGMLLIWERPRMVEIWMLNMEISLDVGFFDRRGVLLDWRTLEPDGGREIYASPAPARYVLEMNKGWFARHRLRPGDRLQIPDDSAYRLN